jgi:Ca2+-binding EF-hand superfamily protein
MKIKSTLLLGAFIATTSFSQDGDRPRPPGGPGGTEGRNPADMLKRSDTDGDGKVSKDEFIKARAAEMEEAFARIDGNSDGYVDEAEASQIAERMRAAGARGGPEGMRRPEGEGMRRPEGDSGFRRPPEGGDRPEGGPRPDGDRPQGEGMRRPEGGPRPDGDRPEGGPRPEGPGAFMEQAFGRMDQDGNGQLSREEFTQGMAKMREMMGRGGMGRGEGPGGSPGAGRPPGGGGEGGFRRPPQQGGEGTGKPRPPLEGEGEKPAPAPEKKSDA